MIYTITLNPALDRTIEVDGLLVDDANRVLRDLRYAGGKGIDISRVIKELGGETVALGFVGGYTGLELEGRLINEGVLCDFTRIGGETRTNIVLVDRKKRVQYLLNAQGPEVTPAEIGLFFEKIRSLPRNCQFVTVSGSVPPGVSPTIYAQIITTLKGMGIERIALDADGELLRQGCNAGPYVIKPNIHEFQRLVGRPMRGLEEMAEEAKGLIREKGIEVVLVSVGGEGLLGVREEGVYHAIPPQVETVSAVGAGDATLAGFILATVQERGFEDALRLAAAAGTATVLTPGTELCYRKDVARIEKEVKILKLS